MIPRVSLREALADINLLGNALAGESWTTWKTLLIAAMGEALTDEERSVFRKITQREHEPRLAQRIGIDRRAKNITPTLRDYLEERASE
jgi:hypothetical protein